MYFRVNFSFSSCQPGPGLILMIADGPETTGFNLSGGFFPYQNQPIFIRLFDHLRAEGVLKIFAFY